MQIKKQIVILQDSKAIKLGWEETYSETRRDQIKISRLQRFRSLGSCSITNSVKCFEWNHALFKMVWNVDSSEMLTLIYEAITY